MRRFEVVKTPDGYTGRELPDEQSFSAAPRKPSPVAKYTAQALLDFMFADGIDSQFIPRRVVE